MNRYNSRRNLQTVFENGVLPTMVYLTRHDFSNQKMARPLHSHDSLCELLLVYKGSGSYRINNKVYALEGGDLIFCNQDDRHEVSSDADDDIGTYCFGIGDLQLKGMPRNHLVSDGQEYVKKAGSLFPFLLDICEQIYQLNLEGQVGNTAAQLLCSSLLVMALQQENYRYANIGNSKGDKIVHEVVNYLDKNYMENLTLEKIAADFRCSPSYISHTFKKATADTPIQYVIKRRIGLAQNLLISSDMTATQIAARVGYDNSNYFSSLFLKYVGVTPIEYRKRYLAKLKGIRTQ